LGSASDADLLDRCHDDEAFRDQFEFDCQWWFERNCTSEEMHLACSLIFCPS
jgi:hypothetical protein